ncbi:MAG TPA: ABC transporter permease [Gemmatimonadaceae bacterium]|nr:ABC transporter permease [Gemmatimonadaceae bacterium]
MNNIASLLRRRLRALFRRSIVEREMHNELAFHFELEKKERMRAGASSAEAHRAAMHAFGSVDHVKEAYRDARGTRPLENLVQDLRYGVRVLRRNPLFAAAAITTLGLGLGATLAVFNVVNGVLLRPLPYKDPERINVIWVAWRWDDGTVSDMPLSSGWYSDIERDSRSFDAVAAFRAWPYALAESPDAEREAVAGARVSPALFDVLGISPAVGRAFTREEAVPGAPNVALISHDLWQRKFGGNRDIIGKQIYLSDAPFTLTGVMPPGFAFPRGAELPAPFQFGLRTDVWTPLVFDSSEVRNYDTQNLMAVGKLSERCGTGECSASVVQSELTGLLIRSMPAAQDKHAYKLVSMADQAAARIRRPLLILLGAVAFVLAIAAANVISLLIGRVHARQRELAVRSALGAARGRLARQLIAENLVLCLLGMVVGLTLAFWGTKVMLSLVPGSLPRADDIGFDWRVLSVAGLLALIAALGFGVAAAYAARLRFTRAAVSVSKTRRVLVMTEVALSLTLLIGAALLTRSFLSLQQVRPGFDPSNALTARVSMPLSGRFQPLVDGPRWSTTFDQITARLASAPGIDAAGGVFTLPMSGAYEGGGVRPIGKVYPAGQNPSAQVQVVSGDYFGATRTNLVAGRVFDASDNEPGRATMIVNRKFAREHYGSETDALGREVAALFEFARDRPNRVIVGVVDDVKTVSLDADAPPQVYVPLSQHPAPAQTLVIRVSGNDPLAAVPLVRQTVHDVSPSATVKEVRTFESVVADSLARQRFNMTLVATFAILALVLAFVGLYGVLALIVGQRRREIGVRLALGATPGSVVRAFLGEGVRVVAIGVVIGLAGAFALTRVLSSMLYGISTTDVSTFAGAALFVGLVAIFATWVPARRASRVDPRTPLAAE